jgi:hypothetical protein
VLEASIVAVIAKDLVNAKVTNLPFRSVTPRRALPLLNIHGKALSPLKGVPVQQIFDDNTQTKLVNQCSVIQATVFKALHADTATLSKAEMAGPKHLAHA